MFGWNDFWPPLMINIFYGPWRFQWKQVVINVINFNIFIHNLFCGAVVMLCELITDHSRHYIFVSKQSHGEIISRTIWCNNVQFICYSFYLAIVIQWKYIRFNTVKQSEHSFIFGKNSAQLRTSLTFYLLKRTMNSSVAFIYPIKLWFPPYDDKRDKKIHFHNGLPVLERNTHSQQNSKISCLD